MSSTTTRREEVINGLMEGIKRLTNSQSWQEWLTVQSRFHHYDHARVNLLRPAR